VQLPKVKFSPLQQVDWPAATAAGVELYVKRDELLDPRISGNKWRKLLPQLAWYLRQGKTRFATVGGVHSNHIPAFAAAMERLFSSDIANLSGEGSLGFEATDWRVQSDIANMYFKNDVEVSKADQSDIANMYLGVSKRPSKSHFAYVRGEIPSPLSPSLPFAKTCGIQLKSATRNQVRNWRISSPTPEELDGPTWLPEGGTNKLGLLVTAS